MVDDFHMINDTVGVSSDPEQEAAMFVAGVWKIGAVLCAASVTINSKAGV